MTKRGAPASRTALAHVQPPIATEKCVLQMQMQHELVWALDRPQSSQLALPVQLSDAACAVNEEHFTLLIHHDA